MSRGSEKKTSKKSGRKVSFITPIGNSMRISAVTPLYASVKDRPKTPIPSRSSSVYSLSLNKKYIGKAALNFTLEHEDIHQLKEKI
ncbi:hypothetical protein CDAR_469271 [Caerostris darwini]|uniref:Uncharacterized protein n=1 Tax=Caerostris darwini TaxID=1538125 RepID=A0AAV4Q204_9ARAC|nr:hypothetical protein CDAR_469271 [Caerostris darwini]